MCSFRNLTLDVSTLVGKSVLDRCVIDVDLELFVDFKKHFLERRD